MGFARLIEYRWWEPVSKCKGVDCWYRTLYIVWDWDSRDAKISVFLNATGTLKKNPRGFPVKSVVRFYLGMQSDRGKIKTGFALRMKPDFAKQLEKVGLMDFITNLSVGMLIANYPLSVMSGIEGLFLHVATAYGTLWFYKKMFLPIYVTDYLSRSKGVWEDTYEFITIDSLMFNNWYMYEPVWWLTYEDDAGCDGCIFWWCWGCQTVDEPSADIGISILIDPEPVSGGYEIAIARVLTIVREESGERAYFAVVITRPVNVTVEFTIPPDAEVYNLTIGPYISTIINRELTGGRYPILSLPKPSSIGVKIRGIDEGYFPKPTKLVKTYTFSTDEYEAYSSLSPVKVVNGTAYISAVLILEKKSVKAGTQLEPVPIALATASVVALVGIPLAVRHAIAEVRKRRFVRKRKTT